MIITRFIHSLAGGQDICAAVAHCLLDKGMAEEILDLHSNTCGRYCTDFFLSL